MNVNEVKFDCLHFQGAIPCKPNKLHGAICSSCSSYQPIEKRILIIKLGALGDVIRTTPLLSKLREEHVNAHITWLTLSPAVSIFALQNSIFDIVINLDKDKEACLLMQLISADQKYGFTWEDDHVAACTPAAEHKLMTGFFDQISKENTKSYLEEIFEICHFTFNKEPYQIRLNNTFDLKWKQNFTDLAKDKIIVGLNTGCGPRWNTRLWSDAHWTDLALKLKAAGYFPVFLGGALEDEKNKTLAIAAGVYYPGHFSLEEFIAITNNCSVVVTQVTMMMHIATALQKKLVLMNTIFNPHEFELYGRGVLIGPPSPCLCYFGNSCSESHPCMMDITPEVVLEALSQLN
jgi:heptosyltransferase-2